MKTRNFIPTLLALIIRVMVSGQTPDNQGEYRTLPILCGTKHQSSPNSGIAKKQSIKEKSEAVQKDISANPSVSPKVYPTLVSSEETSEKPTAVTFNKPVLNTASVKEEKTNPTAIDNNTFNYFSNSNCYATMVYAKELLKQSEELSVIESALRAEAKNKKGAEKLKLLEAAKELVKQSEIKQIQASEISGKISLEKFKAGEITFKSLVFKVTDQTVIIEAQNLNSEAVYSIRLAKEMREEAYSISNNAYKLGTMNNAEEKEAIGLNKQGQAIQLLKQSTASKTVVSKNDMAVK